MLDELGDRMRNVFIKTGFSAAVRMHAELDQTIADRVAQLTDEQRAKFRRFKEYSELLQEQQE